MIAGARPLIVPLDASHETALHAINRASPIEAGSTFYMDRQPDFFAWPRAVFQRYQYFGMVIDRALVGYLLAGTHEGWSGRAHERYCYIGDARVLPEARGAGLTRVAAEHVRESQPSEVDIGFCFMKRKNASALRVARSASAAAGVPVAAACDYIVRDLLAVRSRASATRKAHLGDAADVARLLRVAYAARMFAPRVDPNAEDLGCGHRWDEDYAWVAERAGRIVGFLAARDASALRVTRVLKRSALTRVLDGARWLSCAARGWVVPLTGPCTMRTLTVTHFAVENAEPAIARALIDAARSGAAECGARFVRVGYVASDPLAAALRWLPGWAHMGCLHLFARNRARLEAALVTASRPFVNLLAI